MSPLLFVLCMDPLSKKLNGIYPKVGIDTEERRFTCNHLLFIDDLKLVANKEEVISEMVEEAKSFFALISLEMNIDKSTTNSPACADSARLLESHEGYKYLGLMENASGKITDETKKKIWEEIQKHCKKLGKTKLNAGNLFKAMNEHAISLKITM